MPSSYSNSREYPDSVTWPELLARAPSPEEVVRISLDFFASLTPEEVNSLPRECVPPHRFSAPEQVVEYAFTLVRQRCSRDDDNAVLVRLANFFSHAARRVAELMSELAPAAAANASIEGMGPRQPRT